MKKYIIGLVFLASYLLLPELALAQTSCLALESNNLRYKSRDIITNGEVSSLQQFLQTRGFLASEPTGYFGLATFQAVKDFQKENDISPTGFVGVLTKALIEKTSCLNIIELPSATTTRPTLPNIISPKGGEVFHGGDKLTVSWSPYYPLSLIEVVAVDGGYSFGVYGKKYQNNEQYSILPGQFSFTVSTTTPSGSYFVRITTVNGEKRAGKNFTILNSPVQSEAVKVISPNGGETYEVGENIKVKWKARTSIPKSAYMNILLVDTRTFQSGTIATVRNTGSAKVLLPEKVSGITERVGGGDFYKITVSYNITEDAGVSDSSNGNFTIDFSQPRPVIEVLSPKEGDQWEYRSKQKIVWESTNATGPVNIELQMKKPGQLQYEVIGTIASNQPESGSYDWTLADSFFNKYVADSKFRIFIGGAVGGAESEVFSIPLPKYIDTLINKIVAATAAVIRSGVHDVNYDFNNDGAVDYLDTIVIRASRLGATMAQSEKDVVFSKLRNTISLLSNNSAKYIPEFDFNDDGKINVADVLMLNVSFPGATRI